MLIHHTFSGCFLKIGHKQHMEQLLNGYVFFNTVQFFAGLEDTVNRGDPYERAVEIYNHDFNSGNLQMVKEYQKDVPCGNVFCLYMHKIEVTESNKKYQAEISASNLGDYCIVIRHPQEFIDRIAKQVQKQKHVLKWGVVKYIDFNKDNIVRTPFIKGLDCSHQNEFRFYFNRNKNKFKGFNIGSIADIAHFSTLKDFLASSFIKFDIPELVKDKYIKERD